MNLPSTIPQTSIPYIPELSTSLGGRKAQIFQAQLGNDQYRPLGHAAFVRICSSVHHQTAPILSFSLIHQSIRDSDTDLAGRDFRSPAEAGNMASRSSFSRLLQSDICCAQKGWGLAPHYKSKESQFLPAHASLQAQEHPEPENILLQNDFMAKVDLKDAYLTVPMHHTAYKYLRFTWEGKCYEFTSFPFSLAPARLIFTKLLKPVVSFLRSQGVRLLIYLDDILLMASSKSLLEEHLALTINLLSSLGFLLNSKKCVTKPSQIMEFLGFMINSIEMTLSLPEDKISKIKKECCHALNQHSMTGRQLAHLIGLLSACIPAILEAPLHYRALQRLRHQAVGPRGNNFD